MGGCCPPVLAWHCAGQEAPPVKYRCHVTDIPFYKAVSAQAGCRPDAKARQQAHAAGGRSCTRRTCPRGRGADTPVSGFGDHQTPVACL